MYLRYLFLLVSLSLAACSSGVKHKPVVAPPVHHNYQYKQQNTEPRKQHPSTIAVAMQQLGVPYRYGGNDPSGFDCSGLVYYAYKKTGKRIPRNTSGQYHYARKVQRADLRPGDLVFFRISKKKISHVGIYLGRNRFVHAPSRGKHVQVSQLDNKYWQRRFVTAGRIQ